MRDVYKRQGLFNANAQTLLPSLELGAAGFSGVMANFHPDLYARLYQLFCQEMCIRDSNVGGKQFAC